MPEKAHIAFLVIAGLALLTVSVPVRGSELVVLADESNLSAQTAQNMTEEQIAESLGLPDLSLKDALRRTLEQSPRLSAYAAEVTARESEAREAGLYPNPELSVEVENFGGSGELSGTKSAETAIRINQLIELGGKRARRQELGRLEQKMAEGQYEIARVEVLSEATMRFIAVLSARKKLFLAQEEMDLAKRVLNVVEDQIAAGKTADIERVRFQTLVADAGLREQKAQRELYVARQTLAHVWGSRTVDFSTVQGSLEIVGDAPDWTELSSRLVDSPTLILRKNMSGRADRNYALERANGIPDITVGLGVRNVQETGDNALLAEVSMPLPIFNRNRDSLDAARARKAKAEAEAEFAHLEMRAGLSAAWQKMRAAHSEAIVLRDEVLPAIQKSFDAVTYGYQVGKFGFLELLEAERSLFAEKNRYLDALTAYHMAVSEIERILGQKILAEGKTPPPNGKELGSS